VAAPHLDGKITLISGATSGIGAATARALARAGARVIACGRDQARLAQIAPHVDLALTLDVTDPESIRIAAAAVLDRYGGLDVLINNAGIGCFAPVADTTEARLQEVMEVNFHGAVRLFQAFRQSLLDRKGALVQIASVAGLRGYPNHTAYCASKHALIGWSEALRMEWRGTGVAVHVICPPAIDTPFFVNAGYHTFAADHPGLALMSAEQVAEEVVEAIQSGDRRRVISPRAKLLYALSLIAPGVLERLRK
jgi:uncharacterized protein